MPADFEQTCHPKCCGSCKSEFLSKQVLCHDAFLLQRAKCFKVIAVLALHLVCACGLWHLFKCFTICGHELGKLAAADGARQRGERNVAGQRSQSQAGGPGAALCRAGAAMESAQRGAQIRSTPQLFLNEKCRSCSWRPPDLATSTVLITLSTFLGCQCRFN